MNRITNRSVNFLSLKFVERCIVISDKDFQESANEYSKEFTNQVLESALKEDETIMKYNSKENISLMNKFLAMNFMSNYDKKTPKTHKYNFYDSLLVYSEILNNKIKGDYRVINRNKRTYNFLAKKDSTTYYRVDNPYVFNMKVYDIKVNKKDKKVIQDIECYKVNLKARIEENPSDVDLIKLTKNQYKTIEMYVTDKINLVYHPFIKNDSILKKFYPLELKISESHIKGAYKEILLVEVIEK